MESDPTKRNEEDGSTGSRAVNSGDGGSAGQAMELLHLGDGRVLEFAVRGPEHGPVVLFHHGMPGSAVPLGSVFDSTRGGRDGPVRRRDLAVQPQRRRGGLARIAGRSGRSALVMGPADADAHPLHALTDVVHHAYGVTPRKTGRSRGQWARE
jgi:hypothetical protein